MLASMTKKNKNAWLKKSYCASSGFKWTLQGKDIYIYNIDKDILQCKDKKFIR